jgi:hypothetical protein
MVENGEITALIGNVYKKFPEASSPLTAVSGINVSRS